ncbi:MAG: YifB family Mg chelatase-like AAA ATPase [Candidatus Taylorbacteria bacterium]|nr:YifB family Mg chelatase-like AAA ATPase [Candidatus Taylorbacteria bacterium]
MSVSIFSAALSGIDAKLIEVEVDSSRGIHSFNIVGLADKAVQESKERIGSAMKNSGFLPPKSKTGRVTVNLAPADIKKEGPAYDLPIALGYLFETKQIKFDPKQRLFAGELSLDGRLKNTAGILAMAILAKKSGFKEVIVPSLNAKEAAIISNIDIIGAETLSQVISHLDRTCILMPTVADRGQSSANYPEAFISIRGQEYAKRALIVAAAGAHNVFMSGPPGTGKTLLARALTDILPPLSFEEAIEVAKIYSSIGLIDHDTPLSLMRPFRSPHHTTSAVAVVGGGTWPRPGEISLAHRGVLFLDELPEFPRNVLEALRQPIEDGIITISRASGSLKLPAKFMLIAAMNPCPCGNYGSQAECLCMPFSVLRYRKKVSGPLLDRIDIQINVPRETITTEAENETVETQKKIEEIGQIKKKITKAKEIQLARFKNLDIFSNSEMSYKNVDKLCLTDKSAKNMLKKSINQKGLSLRTYHKTLKVARTCADLDGSETIKDNHMAEAMGLRMNEKRLTELG